MERDPGKVGFSVDMEVKMIKMQYVCVCQFYSKIIMYGKHIPIKNVCDLDQREKKLSAYHIENDVTYQVCNAVEIQFLCILG